MQLTNSKTLVVGKTWKRIQSGGGSPTFVAKLPPNSGRSPNANKEQESKRFDPSTQVLQSILRDDRAFQQNPDAAYAIAWGVSLYLAERQTKNYTTYLKRLSQLPAGEDYSARDRYRDFVEAFGSDSSLLIQSADRYLHSIFD